MIKEWLLLILAKEKQGFRGTRSFFLRNEAGTKSKNLKGTRQERNPESCGTKKGTNILLFPVPSLQTYR